MMSFRLDRNLREKMKQKQIYFEDPYQKEATSTILKVDGDKVWLKENLFFPKTKGEPNDLGSISNIQIKSVEKDGDEVILTLDKEAPFKEDQEVEEVLDWDFRYNAMKLHSALHFVAGIFERDAGVRAVAGNVYNDKAVLTFKTPVPQNLVVSVEETANELIAVCGDIKTFWDEKREGFRWCQVMDLEPIPCGGLHIKNVGEIGKLEIDGNGAKVEVKIENSKE